MITVDVLCDLALVELLRPLDHAPIAVPDSGSVYIVARYDQDALYALTDEQIESASAFWRWTPGLNIEVPYDEDEIRKAGLLRYIWSLGVTSDRHVAGAIADLAKEAGMGQVEFVAWITAPIEAAGGLT